MDNSSPEIPITSPRETIGETKKSNVEHVVGSELVVKSRKAGNERVFPDVASAKEHIETARTVRSEVVAELDHLGASEQLIPKIDAVIYKDHKGIQYVEAQQYYPDATPLSSIHNLSTLPDATLSDLRAIFLSNVRFWKKNGYSLDIVGSKSVGTTFFETIARNLRPLYHAENIIIDNHQVPHFIDMGKYHPKAKNDAKTKVRHFFQIAGSLWAVHDLDKELKKRHVLHTQDLTA